MTALAEPSIRQPHRAPVAFDLPAWPVLALLWGLPLWWMFGLMPFYLAIMAVPMLAFLVRSGRVELVPGVMPWLAFVAWMLPCALALESIGNLIGYSMRLAQFAGVALALVYVVNAKRTLPDRRLLSALTFTWIFVIGCGYLGLIWPDGQLTLTIGRLLPDSLLQNEYVSDLVFPSFAEVQDPWGAEAPFVRPAAPFAYTNGWGAAIVVLTPVAIAWALERGTKRAVVFLMLGVIAMIPPAVASTNRGLFVGLFAVFGYMLLRMFGRGHVKAVLWLTALGALVVVLLLQFGLFDAIAQRQDTVDTTEGRSDLYVETFTRTLSSPLIGYGSPRPSFTSEITVGTQGALWNTMFCFGFVGLALLAWFLIGALLRSFRAPTTWLLWLHSAIFATIVISAFYGLDRHMIVVCIVIGILLRNRGRAVGGSVLLPGAHRGT